MARTPASWDRVEALGEGKQRRSRCEVRLITGNLFRCATNGQTDCRAAPLWPLRKQGSTGPDVERRLRRRDGIGTALARQRHTEVEVGPHQ